ncbi:phosphoenolpyruvate--protein phosphotransferase [Anaeromassilibacillus sp. An200]|uniref:phosphoenolpyruvate--protein phosphotransferase n=1 Tax=Anaeromassilibacillus sp. An200 TaxID=1965587 RepID=UPI000B3701E5|nr:phosphoenolpyruvate--protein phosphotransferase [Anaeromassilibacillus sp. An200]OUP13120.1 phosphoenolpyruvate--protein phosphotransferase [Anaeromassilibacillus sp. An200]
MRKIRGVATSGGVACGLVHFVYDPVAAPVFCKAADVQQELARVELAWETAREELDLLCGIAGREIGGECEKIFEIHRMMLDDEDYSEAVRRVILEQGACAEFAVRRATIQLGAMFSGMEDAYMRARIADVQDIGRRLLHALNPALTVQPPLPEGCVAAAPYFTPSQILQLCGDGVRGFLAQEGSSKSHAAILARMLDVPAVTALGASYSRLYDGGMVIADGFTGDIILDPDDRALAAYREYAKRPAVREETLRQLCSLPARTRGGRRVGILANIWKTSDLPLVVSSGAEGVGLFRTESLFRNRTEPPGEEEQLRIYRSAARQLGDHPMTVRTASLGAHSQVSCIPYEEEPNPVMGVRGIRFSLEHPDLFSAQLRALLRAAADFPVGLTFPMVTGVEELRRAKELLHHAMEELRDRNVPFCENIRVGVMVDTPAAALIAEALAREVDFFDVGTNGLTQFALAADRANPALTTLYDFHHPAVLELVKRAVFAAKNAGIPAIICGDAAADPLMLGFFLSLGVEALSVAPSSVLELRRAVRSME